MPIRSIIEHISREGLKPMEEPQIEFKTWFRTRGFDKGWTRPLFKRHILARFGDNSLGYVRLSERHFEGYEYHGAKDIEWEGTPICVLSLPRAWDKYSYSEESDWRGSRPSLSVILSPPSVTEPWTWTPEELVERMFQECEAWYALPETARLKNRVILYTDLEGELTSFTSDRSRHS